MTRLNPYPSPIELGALGAARCFKLDDQLSAVQLDLFAVPNMSGINQKQGTDHRQLERRKRQNQSRALIPTKTRNAQGKHTKRQVKPGQLGRAKGAMAL